jgi:hypothetical protein
MAYRRRVRPPDASAARAGYLLNSAGRPKLLSMIAEITANEFTPFRFS